jgi:hypothetical protein
LAWFTSFEALSRDSQGKLKALLYQPHDLHQSGGGSGPHNSGLAHHN